MKILAYPGDSGACAHYRIGPYWKLTNHQIAFSNSEDDPNIDQCDVVVLPRAHTPAMLNIIRRVNARGGISVLEFDDNFHAIPWYNPAKQYFAPGSENLSIFETALKEAAIVTASTRQLAESYKLFRSDIMVCPNFITDEHFDAVVPHEITGKPKRDGQIRIGYIGSHTHYEDVALLAKPLTLIKEKYPDTVQFAFFGYPPILPLHVRTSCEYWPGIELSPGESVSDFMLRYYREVVAMDLDIGLAPLADNIFNQCKSNIKVLEYGIAGVPVVASDIGPYKNTPLAASYDADWFVQLRTLVESPSLRAKDASDRLAHIKEYATAAASIHAWEAVIDRAVAVTT